MLETPLLPGGILVALLVLALFFWRKQTEKRRLDRLLRTRSFLHSPAANGEEAQTRFVETRQRKPYQLLNTAEQALYHRLLEAMPNLSIFCRIGIAQLAQLRGRHAVNEIRDLIGRSVDFLVCMPDFSIIAAIELAWPGDNDPAQKNNDERKRRALENLGIPLIVFHPHHLPEAPRIAEEIARAIVDRRQLEAQRLQREASRNQARC